MSIEEIDIEADAQRSPDGFDEVAYLAAYPDIAESVRAGIWKSALHHYRAHGEVEQRLADVRYLRARDSGDTDRFIASHVDLVYASPASRCLISGWAEDHEDAPLSGITVRSDGGAVSSGRGIARCRRRDVEEQRSSSDPKLHGFWTLVSVREPVNVRNKPDADRKLKVALTAGLERRTFTKEVEGVSEERLRELAIGFLANALYFGNPTTEAFLQLDSGIGQSLIDLNVEISLRVAAGAHVVHCGSARASYDASIIVCLYGIPDFLMLQAALFSRCKGCERYEFIYVSNSPELAERLVRDATIACQVYGLAITLVLLPGNAGFGVANNVAVNAARTNRLLFVNPDVLPRDPDWPARHTEAVRNLPPEQVALFGVPLYYDDGSLMHGGMYFEIEGGLSLLNHRMVSRDIMRTEHYGKGAPPEAREFLVSRPVPAVTGAFMSIDRTWFESLSGFSPEFIFGHYEDADLCLRSLQAGRPAWIQDLPFWHLESKGSSRQPVHEGGRLVNRWNLTSRWSKFVQAELNGERPRLLAP